MKLRLLALALAVCGESVEAILGASLDLPKELAERADLPLLSHNLPADFAALRKLMMNHQ